LENKFKAKHKPFKSSIPGGLSVFLLYIITFPISRGHINDIESFCDGAVDNNEVPFSKATIE